MSAVLGATTVDHMSQGPWSASTAHAEFRGIRAWDLVEHVDMSTSAAKLADSGFWVVVATFEGRKDAYRFASVERTQALAESGTAPVWRGPEMGHWRSSLDQESYCAGVDSIRDEIRQGNVYQVNLCRVLSAPLSAKRGVPDAKALSRVLSKGNPAAYSSRIVIPPSESHLGVWIVSASPELYIRVEGSRLLSSPIKGTAAPGVAMLAKDESENVMITDLIRNDLSHVALPGSVEVPELLGVHALPGLSHLQSTVSATLDGAFDWTPTMWNGILAGTFPPGSVSGAPKSSALDIIARLEPVARGPYCGAIGWIDADARRAELAVGIRTFWWSDADGGVLSFGTGAGITWDSDPRAEWEETQLKARRLIGLASGTRMTP